MVKCCHCEENGIHEFDGQHYCETHFGKYVKKCTECEELFLKEDGYKSEAGDWYCDECYNENFTRCHSCDCEITADEALTSNAGEIYCEGCYEDRYFHCSACGEEYSNDESYNGPRGSGTYCSDCFSERYAICSDCGETVHQDNIRYSEEDDQSYCNTCWEDIPSEIHDYGYRPAAEFSKLDWEDNLFMGIEVEVQNFDKNKKVMSDKLVKFLSSEGVVKYFYLKHDGSIGDDGFEIVTHPFTIQYGSRNLKWYKIINWLKRHKFSSYKSGDCGMHIHLNKKFFSDLDITKLRIFFSRNWDYLHKFSKREIGANGEYNHFCKYEQYDLSKFIKNESQEGRYWAINLNSSRETIEFRLFRGTLDYEKFLANIQFAHAIANFVKIHGITSFIYGEGVYKENSWQLFTDWCKTEKYNHLVNCLTKEKLCV